MPLKARPEQGNTTAQANLGGFYEMGQGGLPKDDREAARLYTLARIKVMRTGRTL